MKKLLIIFAATIALNGCATGQYAKPEKLDVISTIETMEPMSIEVQELPASPSAQRLEVNGEVFGGFDKQGMDDLLHMRQVAQANTQLLKEILAANTALIKEREHLLSMASELEVLVNELAVMLYNQESDARRMEIVRRMERALYQLSIVAIAAMVI